MKSIIESDQRYSSSLIKINFFDTRINYQVKKKKRKRNNESNNLIIIPNNSYFDILPSNGFIERAASNRIFQVTVFIIILNFTFLYV